MVNGCFLTSAWRALPLVAAAGAAALLGLLCLLGYGDDGLGPPRPVHMPGEATSWLESDVAATRIHIHKKLAQTHTHAPYPAPVALQLARDQDLFP